MKGEYKHKQFIARMSYSTYRRLRAKFPAAYPSESAANYFLRLARFLEDGRWRKNRK